MTSAEAFNAAFPYYLTSERRQGLLDALRNLPSEKRYYALIEDSEPLQGDGWSKLPIFRFPDGAREAVFGIVLTNSCDLSADNKRLTSPTLSFAPLVPLQRWLDRLESKGIDPARVKTHAEEIRRQAINSMFYLPPGGQLEGEHVAILSQVQSIPMSAFVGLGEKSNIFRLSDVGFYMFLFKLSVHFCRMHEEVDRSRFQAVA